MDGRDFLDYVKVEIQRFRVLSPETVAAALHALMYIRFPAIKTTPSCQL